MDFVSIKHIENLDNIFNRYKNIIVLYSGGVDSSLLIYLGKKIFRKNILALTVGSQIMHKEDLMFAKDFCKKYKIKHKIVKLNILKDIKFKKRSKERCYYCKKNFVKLAEKLRNKENYDVIFDGTNFDDVKYDYRPGLKALREYNVISPFAVAKISKQEIYNLAKAYGLKLEEQKSPCLAMCFMHNEKITKEKISKLKKATKIIKNNIRPRHIFFRIRCSGDILRLEIEKKYFKYFFLKTNIDKIVSNLHKLGFKFITFDLDGYIPYGKRIIE